MDPVTAMVTRSSASSVVGNGPRPVR
jgi:hypothetical protein